MSNLISQNLEQNFLYLLIFRSVYQTLLYNESKHVKKKEFFPLVQAMKGIGHFYFPWCISPPVCQGLLIVADSLIHLEAPHSIRRLWTSDQPDVESST
jgi:hypothetical protein